MTDEKATASQEAETSSQDTAEDQEVDFQFDIGDAFKGEDELVDLTEDPDDKSGKSTADEDDSDKPKGDEDSDDDSDDSDDADTDDSDDDDPESPSGEGTVTEKALIGERRRRQEQQARADAAEAKLKELEAKFNPSDVVSQQQPTEDQIPDPILDPDGHKAWTENTKIQSRLAGKIDASMATMSKLKTDFNEVQAEFMDMVGQKDASGKFIMENGHVKVKDSGLWMQFLQADSPAEFAYNHVTQQRNVKKYSDPSYPETVKAELRKDPEFRKELKAELLAEMEKEGRATTDDVPNLTKTTSAAGNDVNPGKIPENPEELFDDD